MSERASRFRQTIQEATLAVMEKGASAPERSQLQRVEALQRANVIRSYRAELKRDLKAGACDPLDLLAAPVREIESMKVFDLLLAIPKWGRVKVNRTLWRFRISPSKTVGGLSVRQRDELVTHLRRHHPRPGILTTVCPHS